MTSDLPVSAKELAVLTDTRAELFHQITIITAWAGTKYSRISFSIFDV